MGSEDYFINNRRCRNVISNVWSNISGTIFPFAIFLLLSALSCSGGNQENTSGSDVNSTGSENKVSRKSAQKMSAIIQPSENEIFRIGDRVTIRIASENNEMVIDSFQVFANGIYQGVSIDEDLSFLWNSTGSKVGKTNLKTITFGKNSLRENNTVSIVLRSDVVPEQYGYRIIHTYPHDISAYTQGLAYENGILYESTGQRGESTLRKVKLETGELIESLNLPPDLFGEGTCIFGDKIIQLTWTSKIGFVYDKNSFRLLNRINYPTQGWGLTTDGENLIMSDGSHIIYFLEPDYFTELKRIEVFDHEGAVDNLNELEFIDGKIYANVYQTDLIVAIDPVTGKIHSRIDLKGLLPREEHHDRIDVLNGIAYDPENRRLFVTGKRWPKLFEIQLVKK